MKNEFFMTLVAFTLLLYGCFVERGNGLKPLETVSFVDLGRYAGQWYEISRFPNSFQKGCVGSRAAYSLGNDGKIGVLNECYDKSFDGKFRSIKGKAWAVDHETNAKLKVSFFWPFAGDYWIIDLGQEYEYAVIGHPERKYLWILSRHPEMSEDVYRSILVRLQNQGYDTAKLVKTEQQRGE